MSHAGHGSPSPRAERHMGHWRLYDLVGQVFFAGRRRRVFARLAAESGARPGDRVLDVGCGTGYFTRIMAGAVGPAGTALGVDSSGEALARARRVARLPNCTFSEGRAEALDAPDGSFDVLVTSLMIHHLPEEQRSRAVEEMFRVLRPGGRVLVADFRPPTNGLARRLVRAVASPAMEHNPVHLLAPMVRDAGFDEVASGDVQPWIHYVTGTKSA